MKNVVIYESERDQGLSIVVDEVGKIAAVGFDSDVDARFVGALYEREIDASGCSVVPGLVDAHTHPVWTGDRVHEFAMKVNMQCMWVCVWGWGVVRGRGGGSK